MLQRSDDIDNDFYLNYYYTSTTLDYIGPPTRFTFKLHRGLERNVESDAHMVAEVLALP